MSSETPRSTADLDLAVRQRIYDVLFEHQRVPLAAEVAAHLGCSTDDVRAAFRRMKDAHVLVLQQGDSEVLMANPFSAVPTFFIVSKEDKSWWGNCIWDALGVAAMLGGDATVTTGCADCGDEMTVLVESGQARLRGGQSEQNSAIIHFSVPARKWWDNIKFT